MIEDIQSLEKLQNMHQIDYDLNLKLAGLYEKNNDFVNAAKEYAFIGQYAEDKQYFIDKTLKCIYKSGKKINKALDEISYISSPVNVFPEFWRFYLDKNGRLQFKNELFIFKFLQLSDDEYKQFICPYNQAYNKEKYNMVKVLNDSGRGDMHYNFKSEIINSKMCRKVSVEGDKFIMPVAATKDGQKITFEYNKGDNKKIVKEKIFSPYQFEYFKLKNNIKIYSDNNIIAGEKVKLNHSKKRKKLVLDIFIDTLSFKYLKNNDFRCVKEIYDFFKEGIIFSENYSIGEYTRPVVSGMRSGMYTYNHGMFNDKVNTKIPKRYKLIAEVMREYGYNTAEFSGDTGQPSGDLLRGINRAIVQNGHDYRTPEIVEDVIDHLESFKECDNYIRMSILDIHRSIEENAVKNIFTQSFLDFEERFEKSNGSNSVFQKASALKYLEYEKSVRKVSYHLSLLFKYIKENYKEEEYIVLLSSDHGAMLLDDDEFLLKDSHTNTALMIRGAGIKKKGLYDKEMTSAIDLYSILSFFAANKNLKDDEHDSNLPEILGGSKRNYVISESLYPMQTYKMCIRNSDYEYRLETEKYTKYDGSVDLKTYKSRIIDRKTLTDINDDKLESYFYEIAKIHNKR